MMTPIELSELPELHATEVAWRNADLKFFSNRVYQFAGLPLRFERLQEAPESHPMPGKGVWLALSFGGQVVVVHCSHAWVQTWLQAQGWSLEEFSDEALELLGQTRLAPLLPAGVVLQRMSFASPALPSEQFAPLGTWGARHTNTQETSAIALSIWAQTGFPSYAFFGAWDAWLARHDKPRLSSLPWTLPLIAARWTAQAADLDGLAVGDVLLIDA